MNNFRFRIAILTLLLTYSLAAAQEQHAPVRLTTEQLFQYYRSLKDPSRKLLILDGHNAVKCGFSINAQLYSRWNTLTPSQKLEFSVLMQSPTMQCDTIIGRFRISFDTTGAFRPALLNSSGQQIPNSWREYIDSVGAIFNHVWDVEITQMGYDPPPFEDGDLYYNVLIDNPVYNGSPLYGQTQPISPPYDGINKYQSYIEIENDYQGFDSPGISGLEVTAAHEFHHAIQIGAYGLRDDNELYAYELTSTWFEDVVYTDVNDYYNYLSDYFIYDFCKGRAFNSNIDGGYERCVWGHYLAKRFGINTMRDIWTIMKAQPYPSNTDVFLESNNLVLLNRGSNLQAAFTEFTNWNYYTKDRADTLRYYPEGNHYPRFRPLQYGPFHSPTSSDTGYVEPLSSSMYEFDLPSDTIISMIANVEVDAAERFESSSRKVYLTLSSRTPAAPYQQFSNGLTAKIFPADTTLWRSSFSQGVYHDTVTSPTHIVNNLDAWPSPFRPNTNEYLFLPIQDNNVNSADVYLYSSSLNLTFRAQCAVKNVHGSFVIEVPASEVKSRLSSGIYFVVAKTRNGDYKWKVAVVQ